MALKDALRRFKDREQAWLASHSKLLPAAPQHQQSAHNNTINSADDPDHHSHHHSLDETSCHYGELAFLLLGLKPMVLVQMPTRDLAKSYHTHILRPHLIHYPPLKDYHLHSHEITTDLQSPEMSLRGSIIVWRDETADRIRPFLDLAMPCQPPVEPSLSTSKSSTASGNSSTVPPPCLPPSLGPSTISEETLASLLDYPGRLPQSYLEFPTMLEVSYWDDDGPTLLTAFAAQKDQLELVRLHFAFYRNAMLQHLDIRLKLQVLDMATQALK